MYSRIHTAALQGIHSIPVEVEVDLSPGLPVFDMVGNVTAQVREGRERIKTALHNLGILLPAKRITINLSPSRLRKDGAGYDVPMAVALLGALEVIDFNRFSDFLFIGELNLKGEILPVNGILPIVSDEIRRGTQNFIVPYENLNEARLVYGARVYGFESLGELLEFLKGKPYEEKALPSILNEEEKDLDFAEVNGQPLLRRAAEIAASGMHNLLLIGPPGAGKTMIAERIAGILPPLSEEERLEVSKIYSIKGLLHNHGLIEHRPFRSPHHTVSSVGLSGGGGDLMPGEISLAHTGVLFLDELTEFQKSTLELLRQPMEDKSIRITRASGSVEYPTDFLLLGSMNPCNCGYYPNMQLCHCTPINRKRYIQKLSQPLIDRIDICVTADALSFSDLTEKKENESSAKIRRRVEACQQIQSERYATEPFFHNSQIPSAKMKEYCFLSKANERYMADMFEKYRLTGRTYHKILRVARTIADLEGKKEIGRAHLTEALCYRNPTAFSYLEEDL